MSKLLEETIAQVKLLPDAEQDAAAVALMDYLGHRREVQLTDAQREEVRRRINDPNRTFVSYEDALAQLGLANKRD